jgi:hypothetical protein
MRLLLLAVFLVSCEAMQHNDAIWVLPRYILRIQLEPKVTSWIAWTRMDCVVDFRDVTILSSNCVLVSFEFLIPAFNCPGLRYLALIVEVYSSQ